MRSFAAHQATSVEGHKNQVRSGAKRISLPLPSCSVVCATRDGNNQAVSFSFRPPRHAGAPTRYEPTNSDAAAAVDPAYMAHPVSSGYRLSSTVVIE